MPSARTETALDGSLIPSVITTLTPHSWTADAAGTFHTTADLRAEWTASYAVMLAGHADQLSALQRMEGNAEAVLENTKASKLPATGQAGFREDAQREFDAIDAAMRINAAKYGIDPTMQFNGYTYLKMQQTLRANEQLKELGLQGHGVNTPPAARYNGFTNDFQNRTDGTTFYVGGGPGNGTTAIASFFDDEVLTHAPFPVVEHNGVLVQLNQNGNLETPLADVLAAANAVAYTRVLVASDFSTDKTAMGEVRLVPNAKPAPPSPVAAAGSVTTFDGSVIGGSISGLTAHAWIADATGQFITLADLATEWRANYAVMLAGHADRLSPLQRMEGNAEAVIENTGASRLSVSSQAALRQDAQREFDAIDAAMRINQTGFGIDPTQQFNAWTYARMQQTLQDNEQLLELGYQGHGVNAPPATKYDGFTTDFQNRTDGTTFYVGGGPGKGELAIANFFDDDVLTHAPFPVVAHNGVLEQLNQNGNLEDPVFGVVASANAIAYTTVLVASDFSTDKTATGEVRLVPNARPAPAAPAPAGPGTVAALDPAYYAAQHPAISAAGLDLASEYSNTGWKVGFNPNPFFDTNFYLAQNPDVQAAGIDPLQHYEQFGWREGRDPSLMFSGTKYLAANPDVKAAGMESLLHYEQFGRQEGRLSFLTGGVAAADPLVQAAYYDPQLVATLIPTGADAARQAAWSYDTSGWQRGLSPDAFFDTGFYLSHNPDVAAAHINPLLHYEQYGWREGRDPSAAFSTYKYLAAYSDVRAAGMDPLLHYVAYGQGEGRTAFAA